LMRRPQDGENAHRVQPVNFIFSTRQIDWTSAADGACMPRSPAAGLNLGSHSPSRCLSIAPRSTPN
jgi:hypothetical protein